jgi:hypothetical protein
MQISLSTLAIVLGLGVALPHMYALAVPEAYGAWLRKFPRRVPYGVVLMLIGTAWFDWNLSLEQIADFEPYKGFLLFFFGAVGVCACIYVQDFLSVRGLAVVILLMAKTMVDTARWAETRWNLAIVIWAYIWVAAGIWFTIYPWHFRDAVNWETASTGRLRLVSAARVVIGLFVAALGFTVYRGA